MDLYIFLLNELNYIKIHYNNVQQDLILNYLPLFCLIKNKTKTIKNINFRVYFNLILNSVIIKTIILVIIFSSVFLFLEYYLNNNLKINNYNELLNFFLNKKIYIYSIEIFIFVTIYYYLIKQEIEVNRYIIKITIFRLIYNFILFNNYFNYLIDNFNNFITKFNFNFFFMEKNFNLNIFYIFILIIISYILYYFFIKKKITWKLIFISILKSIMFLLIWNLVGNLFTLTFGVLNILNTDIINYNKPSDDTILNKNQKNDNIFEITDNYNLLNKSIEYPNMWNFGEGSKYYNPLKITSKLNDMNNKLQSKIIENINDLKFNDNEGLPSNLEFLFLLFNAEIIDLARFNELLEFLIINDCIIRFTNNNIKDIFLNNIPRQMYFSKFNLSLWDWWFLIDKKIYLGKIFAENWLNYPNLSIYDPKNNGIIFLNIDDYKNYINFENYPFIIGENLRFGIKILQENSYIKIHPQVLISSSLSQDFDEYFPFVTVDDFIHLNSKILKDIKNQMETNNKFIIYLESKIYVIYKEYLNIWYNKIYKYYMSWAINYNNTYYFINSLISFSSEIFNITEFNEINIDKLIALNNIKKMEFIDEINLMEKMLIGLEDFLGLKKHNLSEKEIKICRFLFFKFWFNQVLIYNTSKNLNIHNLNWFDINIAHAELLENMVYAKTKLLEGLWIDEYIKKMELLGITNRGIAFLDLKNIKKMDNNIINFFNDMFLNYRENFAVKYKDAHDISKEWVMMKSFPKNKQSISYILFVVLQIDYFNSEHKYNSLLTENDFNKSINLSYKEKK